jgi:hypothetical protein
VKLFRVLAIIVGGLIASNGQAQQTSQPPNLYSRLKDTLSGKGRKIIAASKDIYSGGMQYGTAVVTPDRSEDQTRVGVAGGFKAVAGGAKLAGTIGGMSGAAATVMAIPIADGAGPVSAWVGTANSVERKMWLSDRGDTVTLQREEAEQRKHNREVGERFKSTLTQRMANPNEYKPQSLIEKLDSFQKDTLPKAQQQLAKEFQISAPQAAQPIPSTPSAVGEPSKTENLAELCGMQCTSEDPAENLPEPENDDPQPLHWKTISGFMQNTDGSTEEASKDMIGKCEPAGAANALEYIAKMRTNANVSEHGENCTAAQFFDDAPDRLTFAKECDLPNWGRTTVLQNYHVKDDRTVEGFIRYKVTGGRVEMNFVNGYCG